MKSYEELLLKLIRCAVLRNDEDFSEFSDFTEWGELFALCSKHSVVGMIYDKLTEVFGSQIPEKYSFWFKQNAFKEMSFQAVRSLSFVSIYRELLKENIAPVVLKGEVLRQLYPQPESRTSLDEDLLIKAKEYPKLKKELSLLGFEEINEGGDDKHWVNKKYSLYFEIHFTPFTKDESYQKWNEILRGYSERTVENKNGIVSLSREDNLIFLILHAAKHFIYSGVGIKQILDIALFMRKYQNDMDFSYIRSALRKTKTLAFAEAVTAFIKKYLYSDVYCFGRKAVEEDFVTDVFGGGSLGKGDEDRVHSANVTASAFKGQSSVKKILFPPAERLKRNYPFCRKNPLLLPLAWLLRLISYLFGKGKKKSALKTGGRRLKLLKKYGLIKE